MSRLVADVRDAWRGLLHQRAFSAAAVITLSIGIAATTAMFAVIRAVVFELPFDQPDRIVTILARGGPSGSYRISREQFDRWRQASDVFEAAAAYTLDNIDRRLSSLRSDPWPDYGSLRQSITDSLLKSVGDPNLLSGK